MEENKFKPSRGLRSEGRKKRGRGSRTPEAIARRLTKYLAGSHKKKALKLESITGKISNSLNDLCSEISIHVESFSLPNYPDEFMNAPTDSKKVLRKYRKMYPKQELEEAPESGRLRFIPPPSVYDTDPLHPPYLALRFDEIFKSASHEIEILNAWDALKAAGVKFPKPDKSRSTTPALHMGIWQRYTTIPYISLDTHDQTPSALAKMDDFLSLIKKYIAPRILDFLKDEFPETYKWNQKYFLFLGILTN